MADIPSPLKIVPPAKRRKVYEAKAGAAPCWFRHLGVYAVADVYGLPELAEAAMDNVGLSICPPPAVRLGSETRAILGYLAGEGAEAFGDCEDLHEMLAEAVVAHPLNFSADDIERPGLSLRLRVRICRALLSDCFSSKCLRANVAT